MNIKYELQNIISGVGEHAEENLIKATAHYLRKSEEASRTTQKSKFTKEQEAKKLIDWINTEGLWFLEHDENRFIARGAEQRVYLAQDERFVYKLNDSIFYRYWLDYFYSLLIHNYFFPATAYQLVGFFEEEEILHAVIKQPYITITENTEIEAVRNFLTENGFQIKRNNDYFNPSLGILLEDLHDENVLTNNKVLFFVDTVFYLDKSFFSR